MYWIACNTWAASFVDVAMRRGSKWLATWEMVLTCCEVSNFKAYKSIDWRAKKSLLRVHRDFKERRQLAVLHRAIAVVKRQGPHFTNKSHCFSHLALGILSYLSSFILLFLPTPNFWWRKSQFQILKCTEINTLLRKLTTIGASMQVAHMYLYMFCHLSKCPKLSMYNGNKIKMESN